MKTVLEQRDVKVDEQAEGQMEQAQVSRELNPVDGQQRLDGLEFDEQFVVDKKVGPESAGDDLPAKLDRNESLAFDGVPSGGQFEEETVAIGAFEKPGSKGAMHGERGINRRSGERLDVFWDNDSLHLLAILCRPWRLCA